MADREKVIADIEEQIAWIRDNDFHKFPGWGHAVLAMKDALALLKEQDYRKWLMDMFHKYERDDLIALLVQYGEENLLKTVLKEHESVEPIKMQRMDGNFSFFVPYYLCGNCRYELVGKDVMFCHHCGKPVNWK